MLFVRGILLLCVLMVAVEAIVETPWNLGSFAEHKHRLSQRRHLISTTDNSALSVVSTTLSDDGTSCFVLFDQPTNKGGYSSTFPCTAYFSFPGADVANCFWSTDGRTIVIQQDLSPQHVSQAFTVGSFFNLLGNSGTITAACAASATPNTCPSLKSGNLFVVGPSSPVKPVVSIATAPSISACQDWVLDLTGSSGSGSRPWSKSSITITGNGDVSALQSYLTAHFTTATPIKVPHSLLTIGETYKVTVNLCNFFGQCPTSPTTTTVQVNSGSTSAPIVSLTGPTSAAFYASNSLSVTAIASVTSCDGSSSSKGLSYVWSAVNSQGTAVKFTTSRVNQLNVAQNSLTPQEKYTVTVVVTDSSSKFSSTASVTVAVSPSPLSASVSPSSMQLFRVDASTKLVLNGQASRDPDDPSNQTPMTYAWTCVTQGQSICALKVNAANQPSITITGSDSSAVGTISTFTLTVSKDSRTASTSVTVQAIAGSAPLVNITTPVTALTQINVDSPFLISGSVQTGASVTCGWSADNGNDFDLTKSPSVLSQKVPAGTTIYNLYLPNSLLPIRKTYHFTLTCGSSASQVVVTTNGPPVPGTFVASPSSGTEMTDFFALTASSWLDPDLPITYVFGFVSPATGLVSSVQSRSTLSYASSQLPAGSATASNALSTIVQVFDGLNASTTATQSVIVAPLPAAQVTSTITAQLQSSQGSTNIDDLKAVISIASSVISRVDCSSATTGFCAGLNRSPCQATANTCGACLNGFVGQSGDSNSACVSKSNAGSSNVQQTCPGNGCSGHGTCKFFDQNGLTLASCPISAGSSCSPECSCADGYAGLDCAMKAADLASDQSLRSTLLSSLHTVVTSEDTTASSVSSVVSSLSGIIQSASNVNSDGLSTFSSIASTTLTNAAGDTSITADHLKGFLGPLDAAITATAVASRRRRNRRLIATSLNGSPSPVDADSAMNYGHSIISNFADIVARDSAPGVPASTYNLGNFRLAQQSVADTSASVSVPLTDIEAAAGQQPSSVQFSNLPGSSGASLSLTQYSSSLLSTDSTTTKYSNVLTGSFPAGSSVTITLANIVGDSGPKAEPAEQFKTVCKKGDTSTYTSDPCKDSGAILHHTCTGKAGTLVSTCPVLQTACSAVNLGGSTGNYKCKTTGVTDTTITCQCTFSAPSSRRLDPTDVQQGATNMVAMTEYIGNEAEQTFAAAPDLTDPAAIQKSLIVIIMFIVLWVSGLVMLAGCIYRQRKMKEIRLEQRLERMQASDRDSAVSSVEEVREKLISYVQAVFPVIFYSEHWLVRLKDEIRRNHSYLMLFNSVDGDLEDKKRILNGLKLLTAQTALMFLLALLYDLQGPTDDGSCPSFATRKDCLDKTSILDNTQTYCLWDASDPTVKPCSFNDGGISFKASLYVQVIVSVFTALLMRPLAYGFNILLAPSVDNIKEKAEEEKRIRQLTGHMKAEDNAAGRERPETKRSSLSLLLGNAEEDPEMAELTKVLVTLIPDDVEAVSKQAKSYFRRFSILGNNNSAGEKAALLSSPRAAEGVKTPASGSSRQSIMSKMRTSIAFVANKVLHRSEEDTVQILFNELTGKIKEQRKVLSGPELAEFDREWGLDENGNFLRNDAQIKGKKDVSDIVLKEMQKVEHESNESKERLKKAMDHHIGIEILHKFILDVLGRDTPAGFIFSGKTEEDFRKSPVRSFRLKVFVGCLIFAANALFVYYSVLRGYIQGVEWQKQYLVACIIQMVLEIYLFETIECIWINVLIPSIVAGEVQRVNRLLLGIIDDICEKAAVGEKLEINDKQHALDATQYLYLSTRLAKAFPNLMESVIVRTYHTHLPGELSYKWLSSEQSYYAYYRRFMGRNSADTAFIVAAIGAMMATIELIAFVPFDVHKMFVRFFQPFLFGGLVMLWQMIVQTTLGIIVTVIGVTVVVMAVMWHYYRHRQSSDVDNEAKISPLNDQTIATNKAGESQIAMQRVKSIRVAKSNEPSYNSNDQTLDNHSVDSENIRAAALVDDDDTVDELHRPAHKTHRSSPKKTNKKTAHKESKSKGTKNAYELVPAAASAPPGEVDIDALINDFKAEHGDDLSDDGSYRLSLSDNDQKESEI